MFANGTTVFGIYPDFVTLRTSVESLKALGFRDDDISLLFPEGAVSRTLPQGLDPKPVATWDGIEPLIGGNLGFLTYIHSAGAGVVSGALSSLGVPSEEADRYEGRIRDGELLVGVRSESVKQAQLVTEILVGTGACNVSAANSESAVSRGGTAGARRQPARWTLPISRMARTN
jgi:hypothetical protein